MTLAEYSSTERWAYEKSPALGFEIRVLNLRSGLGEEATGVRGSEYRPERFRGLTYFPQPAH